MYKKMRLKLKEIHSVFSEKTKNNELEKMIRILHLIKTIHPKKTVCPERYLLTEKDRFYRLLMGLRMELKREHYELAYWELEKILMFLKAFHYQPEIWYNLIETLSILEVDSMFGWEQNRELDRKEIGIRFEALRKFLFPALFSDRFNTYREEKAYKEIVEGLRSESISRSQYKKTLKTIDNMVMGIHEKQGENKEVKDFLKFVMNLIKNDIKYDGLLDVIYTNNELTHFELFPMSYRDEKSNWVRLEEIEQSKDIDFSKDDVMTIPWHKDRVFSNFLTLKEQAFNYDKYNHEAYYYPQLDLCYVHNGRHSTMMGLHKKQGQIKASTIDLSPLFEHIYTDGAYWYSVHTQIKNSEVSDFRFALLFELARRIHVELN